MPTALHALISTWLTFAAPVDPQPKPVALYPLQVRLVAAEGYEKPWYPPLERANPEPATLQGKPMLDESGFDRAAASREGTLVLTYSSDGIAKLMAAARARAGQRFCLMLEQQILTCRPSRSRWVAD